MKKLLSKKELLELEIARESLLDYQQELIGQLVEAEDETEIGALETELAGVSKILEGLDYANYLW